MRRPTGFLLLEILIALALFTVFSTSAFYYATRLMRAQQQVVAQYAELTQAQNIFEQALANPLFNLAGVQRVQVAPGLQKLTYPLAGTKTLEVLVYVP